LCGVLRDLSQFGVAAAAGRALCGGFLRIKRPIAAALCCLCLLVSVQTVSVVTAPVAHASGFQPFWSTLSDITLSMTYSGGKAYWSGSISGNSNVSSIEATA
jgi:hypothetical protein